MDPKLIGMYKSFFGLGIASFFLGIGLFIYVLYSGITGIGEHMIQVKAPGETILTLDEPGNYEVSHEHKTSFEGKKMNSSKEDASLIELELIGPDEKSVTLSKMTSNTTYTIGDREGSGMYEFTLATPGEYKLVTSSSSANQDSVVFTVIHNFSGRLIKTILLCFASLGISSLLAFLFCFLGYRNYSQRSQ